MLISNFSQLKRFSDLCGAEIPRWIERRMISFGDDVDSVRELGADVVADLCTRLIEIGAPALHFYTLNRAKSTIAGDRSGFAPDRARLPVFAPVERIYSATALWRGFIPRKALTLWERVYPAKCSRGVNPLPQ